MAAAWGGVGNASSLLQLLGVDAFGLASMITQAALTARRNRDACLQLAEHARAVAGLLRRLHQVLPQLRRHPETRRPLEQLDDALRRAYLVVRSCGHERAARGYLYGLLTAARTAAELRDAEEEIDRYIRLIPMIGLVATVRVVEGDQEVLEFDGADSTPPPSPRLSTEEVPGSTAIPVLTPTGDVLLPGIEGFQIVGESKPGFTLRACGFPINGTTLCNFQWARYLDDGSRQSIQGATMYDYEVTADDVDTVLAVECTPMDDNGFQGELVREFSNGRSKITCDSGMQSEIYMHISSGEAPFDLFMVSGWSVDRLEPAKLILRRIGYQIKVTCTDEIVIEEEYTKMLQTKVPCGYTTGFDLVTSAGISLAFSTSREAKSNDEHDVRLRDLIVLVMRAFQKKALALDAEEGG